MTLCIAWIRKAEDHEELIFATDSCLSAGERWPTGIKLFDLPRKDALICFAGRTDRAYPLILNLISALQYNKEFQDKSKDVSDLVLFVSDLFTQLVYLITENSEPIDELRAEANFLFGGWSWKEQQHVLFKIYYDSGEQKFIFADCLAEKKTRQIVFIGDQLEEAKAVYYKEFEGEKSENLLDMEPLKVLTIMSRDRAEFTSIMGAIQIAKVYKSGHNEFFGVMWPSLKGKPHFLGKEYKLFEKPDVRYFDPDTLVIHELELPETLDIISDNLLGEYTSFVEKCYPNNHLKSDLSKSDRKILLEVLKHSFYQSVVRDLSDEAINGQPEEIIEEQEAVVSNVTAPVTAAPVTEAPITAPVTAVAEQSEAQPESIAEEKLAAPVTEAPVTAAPVTAVAEQSEAQPENNASENNGDNKKE